MPALLSGPSYKPALADNNIYATALLDGPVPMHLPESGEKSGLIDQAYSEYRNLCAAGVEVDPDAFCARFPAYQTSLRRLVEVHRELEANPNLLRSLERWPSPGDRFHGFHLEQELGRGAFAHVFLAREVDIGNRQVVVKVSLHSDDEAGTIGKLKHPNVVEIHSAPKGNETGFAIVCMPFLGGATLLSVIESIAAKKTLPSRAEFLLAAARDDRFPAESAEQPARALCRGSYLDGVLYIGERLASALAYVHERGILHRDLKPSNVLLRPNGEPVLIDFNLAYDRSIAEHRLGGTLPYMPPEQLEALTRNRTAEPVPADNRSDLYALGVLLYELLAGAHPFGPVPLKLKTADARDFLLGRQRQGPRSLRARNRTVDPAVDALIARCLSHDPAGRPATARELAAELRRLQAPIRRARRWVVANAKAVAVAGVLVGSSAAYGGVQIANMPSRAAVHKQKADELCDAGKFVEAIQEYDESLEANVEQPDVKLARGRAYAKLGEGFYRDGKFDKAKSAFDTALAADNNQPALHFARGRAFQKLGNDKLQAAADDYGQANPKTFGPAAACLGYIRSLGGDPVSAAVHYQDAIDCGYANDAVLNNLAFCKHLSGDYAKAESLATDLLDSSPNLQAATCTRAMARCGQWFQTHNPEAAEQALDDLRQAINRGVTTPSTYFFASTMCAAVLSDRLGEPKNDPLYEEGAKYLRLAVENGYPRECLEEACPRVPCRRDWAQQLPPDMKIQPMQNNKKVDLRWIDPVSD